jgi:hypothetical protein
VLPHFKEGSSIVNTTSINAYKGMASLIPYSSTKGAEVRHQDAVYFTDNGKGGTFWPSTQATAGIPRQSLGSTLW